VSVATGDLDLLQLRSWYDHDERHAPAEPGTTSVTADGLAAVWSPAFQAAWTTEAPPPAPSNTSSAGTIVTLRDAVAAAICREPGGEPGRAAPADATFEWKCFSWDGPAPWYADGALRAAGFVPEDEEVILVAATQALSGGSGTTTAGDGAHAGVTVRIARRPGDAGILADADAVHSAVWSGDTASPSTIAREFWATGSPRPYLSIHVAYLDGRPVSYGRLQISAGSRFGGLWGGATIPAARGHGAYRALVASRAEDARQAGVAWVMVDARPDTSMPILKRLGFRELGRTRPYISNPAGGTC